MGQALLSSMTTRLDSRRGSLSPSTFYARAEGALVPFSDGFKQARRGSTGRRVGRSPHVLRVVRLWPSCSALRGGRTDHASMRCCAFNPMLQMRLLTVILVAKRRVPASETFITRNSGPPTRSNGVFHRKDAPYLLPRNHAFRRDPSFSPRSRPEPWCLVRWISA